MRVKLQMMIILFLKLILINNHVLKIRCLKLAMILKIMILIQKMTCVLIRSHIKELHLVQNMHQTQIICLPTELWNYLISKETKKDTMCTKLGLLTPIFLVSAKKNKKINWPNSPLLTQTQMEMAPAKSRLFRAICKKKICVTSSKKDDEDKQEVPV